LALLSVTSSSVGGSLGILGASIYVQLYEEQVHPLLMFCIVHTRTDAMTSAFRLSKSFKVGEKFISGIPPNTYHLGLWRFVPHPIYLEILPMGLAFPSTISFS
jgi:hypothetical protein